MGELYARNVCMVVVAGMFCWLNASVVSAQTATDLTCSNCVGPGEVAPNAIAYSSFNGAARTYLVNQANQVAALAQAVADLQAQVDGILLAPAPINAAGSEYVGISTATVMGNAGYAGMRFACDPDFGPESRLATTVEVMSATNFPSVAAQAWVQPVLVSAVDAGGGQTIFADASGLVVRSAVDLFSCNGWSSNSAGVGGLTVTAGSYALFSANCAANLAVACAIPVQSGVLLPPVGGGAN